MYAGNYVSVREIAERAEQTSNNTVSKPGSPASDESSGKHHPAKRLKVNPPSTAHADKTQFPKEQEPAVNGTNVSSETVQSETTTKSPSGCSFQDSNASNNMEIVRSPEAAMQAEGLRCENGDIDMKDSKLSSVDQTSLVASLTARKRRGGSILYTLTSEELRDHMRSLNPHICLVSGESVGSHRFSLL